MERTIREQPATCGYGRAVERYDENAIGVYIYMCVCVCVFRYLYSREIDSVEAGGRGTSGGGLVSLDDVMEADA